MAMMIGQIARILANIILALEYSGETIDQDDVVKIMEQLGSDLEDLDTESRKMLSDAFRRIASEYEGEFRASVASIPDDFGLEEEA